MKEHPILFSGEMVRAILEERKTQTRRIIYPQLDKEVFPPCETNECWFFRSEYYASEKPDVGHYVKCPYGLPGDRLWVRETWQIHEGCPRRIIYRADWNDAGLKWKPGIHLRRKDSRINLLVVSVRVQRIQDITQADALAEGIKPAQVSESDPVSDFAGLWNEINGKRMPWEKNPWVWAIEFRKI